MKAILIIIAVLLIGYWAFIGLAGVFTVLGPTVSVIVCMFFLLSSSDNAKRGSK